LHRIAKKIVEQDLEKEFKDEENPYRFAIVCAMWITGFDAPRVSTVYLDKPIKGHTLIANYYGGGKSAYNIKTQ
jgi:type I restriction enzyme R subunit